MTLFDQLKEQIAAPGHDGEVADLVDDQQGEPAEEANLLAQCAFPLGLGQGADKVGQGEEMHAAPGLDGFDPEGDGKVTFPGAWRGSDMLPGIRSRRDGSSIGSTLGTV